MKITVWNRGKGTKKTVTVKALDDFDIQKMTGLSLNLINRFTEIESDYDFCYSDILKKIYVKQGKEVIAEYNIESFINFIKEDTVQNEK